MGSPVPYRVDLFDDEVDSIRTFDPDTQRSLYPVPEVRLLPGREFPMDDAARTRLPRPLARAHRGRPDQGARIYKDIGHGIATAGIEYYLPLFFDADGDDLRLPAAAAPRCAARRGRRRAAALLDRHARAPPLPAARPRAADPAAARTLFLQRRAVLRARPARTRTLALRGGAAGDAPTVGARRCPTSRRPRRRPSRWPTLRAAHRHHAAPRAAGGRERRPAREPARLLRDHGIEPPSVRHAGRVRGRRREGRDHRRAAGRGLLLVRADEAGSRAIQFVTETELFATAPAPRRRHASRSRSAASTR